MAASSYAEAFDAFLEDYFVHFPVAASEAGDHRQDGRWPDPSEDGRRARLAMLRSHRDALAASDGGIDGEIAVGVVEQLIFEDEVLREPSWDPLSHVATAGNGLFAILATEHAPWEERARSFSRRLQGLPDYLDAAVAALTGAVSALHRDTALQQASGITQLIDEGVERGGVEGAESAREAVTRFEAALRELDAEGEGRLGPELFAEKLRHTLQSGLTADEIRERAWKEYEVVRAEMQRVAAQITDQGVAHAIDIVSSEHPAADDLLDACRAEIAGLEAFCREHDVIPLPEEPLEMMWTPVFLRPYGGAFLSPPGPLDKGLTSYFFVTPPTSESQLREENHQAIKLLCIHEAVPGHHVQLAYHNRCDSLVRTVFGSGLFAEGWALHVTQLMMDLGYGGDTPELWLMHWRLYLRGVINAILDVEIHAGEMTEEQALDLMINGGFQEEAEARAKWLRGRLSSTQLCTYFLGYQEMRDIANGGHSLEEMASHGSPPPKYLPALLA